MSLIVEEGTFVGVAIGIAGLSQAETLTIVPRSLVAITVCPDHCSLAMCLLLFSLTFVESNVAEGYYIALGDLPVVRSEGEVSYLRVTLLQ